MIILSIFKKRWVLANLDKIFISDDCVNSFFLFNFEIPQEVFRYLFEKGVLTEFVKRKTGDTDSVLRNIFSCSIIMYIMYDYDCMDIINTLLFEHEPDYYAVFFEGIRSGLQQKNYYDKSYQLLNVISNEITKTSIRRNESYDQAIRYLATVFSTSTPIRTDRLTPRGTILKRFRPTHP